MALTAVRLGQAPHTPVLPGWLASVATISVALTALSTLVPPAIDAIASSTPDSVRPVAVSLVGEVSTAGLPERSPVSILRIRNDGAGAVSWAVEVGATGPGAEAVSVVAWPSVAASCSTVPGALRATDWSTAALAAGDMTALCVRVRSTGIASGEATPFVTVHARPA